MNKNRIITTLLVLIACQWSVQAEMRIWKDKKGNTIEAEFITLMRGKVSLKTTDGKQVRVPLSGLSSVDQEYLKTLIPPKFDIKVKVEIDTKTKSGQTYRNKQQTVWGTVTIEKKNREPCSKQFKATLMLISKDRKNGDLKIMSKKSHSFSVETENKTVFTGEESELKQYNWASSSSGRTGSEYDGYLVVIENDAGNIITTKSNSKTLEDQAGRVIKEPKDAIISL